MFPAHLPLQKKLLSCHLSFQFLAQAQPRVKVGLPFSPISVRPEGSILRASFVSRWRVSLILLERCPSLPHKCYLDAHQPRPGSVPPHTAVVNNLLTRHFLHMHVLLLHHFLEAGLLDQSKCFLVICAAAAELPCPGVVANCASNPQRR